MRSLILLGPTGRLSHQQSASPPVEGKGKKPRQSSQDFDDDAPSFPSQSSAGVSVQRPPSQGGGKGIATLLSLGRLLPSSRVLRKFASSSLRRLAPLPVAAGPLSVALPALPMSFSIVRNFFLLSLEGRRLAFLFSCVSQGHNSRAPSSLGGMPDTVTNACYKPGPFLAGASSVTIQVGLLDAYLSVLANFSTFSQFHWMLS